MITLGIDAHKRTHTVVAVDQLGRRLGTKTTAATTTADHLAIIRWADLFGDERCWAVEDCRHVAAPRTRHARRRGAHRAGAPKLMAHSRDAARTYGKSDPIDALAVARAALREPDLPTAHLDAAARELRLVVDHREDLVAERTRHINRLGWHLHEIDPTWDPDLRAFTTIKHLDIASQGLATLDIVTARIAADLVERIRQLTADINQLRMELEARTETTAPHLRQIHGIGALASAKLIGEVAGIERFRSRHAFARHNGTAPTPVWSGNTDRHRLSRAGNRAAPCRHPPSSVNSSPITPRRDCLPEPPRRPRCHSERSPPIAQATTLRRHLPSHDRRRRPRPRRAAPARRLT
jgi:transposase